MENGRRGLNGGNLKVRVIDLDSGQQRAHIDVSKVVSLPADANRDIVGLNIQSFRRISGSVIDFHVRHEPSSVERDLPAHWTRSVGVRYDLSSNSWVSAPANITSDHAEWDTYNHLDSERSDHYQIWDINNGTNAKFSGNQLAVNSGGSTSNYAFAMKVLLSRLSATGKYAVVCSENEIKIFNRADGSLHYAASLPLFVPSSQLRQRMGKPRDLFYCHTLSFTENDHQLVMNTTPMVAGTEMIPDGQSGYRPNEVKTEAPSLVIDLNRKAITVAPSDGWKVMPLVGEKVFMTNREVNKARVQNIETGAIDKEWASGAIYDVHTYFSKNVATKSSTAWLGIVEYSSRGIMDVYKVLP
jgi:hypothetical protein